MNNKTLASLVKEAREKLGISQREISRRTGIDNNTLAKIEKGERKKPNVLILKKLSYILELDLEKLMKLADYNDQDIEVALNQRSNTITIIGKDNQIIMLEDVIIYQEDKLICKQILKELMTQVDYDKLQILKNMNEAEKKKAINTFKVFIKQNNNDIKQLKEEIENINNKLNKKNKK